MIKIALDAGHGINTPGKRCLKSIDPKETREWELNKRIVEYVQQGLKSYKNVQTLRVDDPTGKRDVPLAERVAKVNNWKPNILISYHHDAGIAGGSGGGITVYRTPASSAASKTYQEALYPILIKHTRLKGNRSQPLGLANFYIIRNVSAPALLVEHGFMDSKKDTPIILTDKFARQCADAHIEFLAKQFSLGRTGGTSISPSPSTTKVFKQGQTGSDIRDLQTDLNSLGYKIAVDGSFGPATLKAVKSFQSANKLDADGYVGPATQSKMKELLSKKTTPTELYRVRKSWKDAKSQKGAYGVLENAIDEAKKYSGYKVFNSKGVQVYPELPKAPTPTPMPTSPTQPKPSDSSNWAKDDWDWATKEGIVDGTRPKEFMTREEVAVALHRLSKRK